MQDATVRASSQEGSAIHWFGSLVCSGCSQNIGRDRPLVYEYLFDGVVDMVQVPPGGWVEPPVGLWPVGTFHVDCYDTLLVSVGHNEGAWYVGTCPLSLRNIASPRPLKHCPMCASTVEFAQTHAPLAQIA